MGDRMTSAEVVVWLMSFALAPNEGRSLEGHARAAASRADATVATLRERLAAVPPERVPALVRRIAEREET